ncbi:MAG: potassium channel protein [Burkholderiales bacterium]
MITIVLSVWRRLAPPGLIILAVMACGTVGYRLIGGPQTTVIDALYMTFITVATIGYGEIVDLSHSPGGRVFTMIIASAGIASFTYMLSMLTAFIVEGDINQALRRKRMQKQIDRLKDHFIICGIGRVGANVAHELSVTGRDYVVVDVSQRNIDTHLERHADIPYLLGDGSEDEVLIRAGVARARGVFAITGEDSKNLVITLSAKALNPGVRVVARCHQLNYIEKIRKVGADAIVSPDFTGGMRIASSMIRPQVVSFLDEMLRSDDKLRVEEVHVSPGFAGRTIGSLGLRGPDYMLLAVRSEGRWVFNPRDDYEIRSGNALVFMTAPQGRKALERMFAV